MVTIERSHDTRIPARSHLISINDHTIDDFLEFEFYNDQTLHRDVVVAHHGQTLSISFQPEEDIRLMLEAPRYRMCENECPFCFIKGLPPGLRDPLYFRDDDYRLSFLFGNFLSLTNLTEADIERIARLRLSPLYVSVHATDPRVRVTMFNNERAALIMDQLRSLIRHAIAVHCQIVVVPGVNDRDTLNTTLRDLSELYPGVRSIGIIPVGRSRYAPVYPLVSASQATQILDLADGYQRDLRPRHGVGVVYAADELFIKSGRAIPESGYYDDMPQIENGIGMVRSFLDDIKKIRARKKIKGRVLFVTSQYAARSVTALRHHCIAQSLIHADNIGVLPVMNDFFGPTVTVSGLLSARDIDHAIREQAPCYDRIVLPPNCTNDDHAFIDNGTISVETFVAPSSLKELISWLQS